MASDDRSAWLEWRRQGIGASDAAAVVHLDPFRSAYRLWLDKTGRLPVEDQEPFIFRLGHELEPVIERLFHYETGLFVGDRQQRWVSRRHPWMRCTPDGFVYESAQVDGDPLGVFEAKSCTPWSPDAPTWRAGKVPHHYQVQVQHQLAVTEMEHAWVAVLIAGSEFRVMELEADAPVRARLIQAEAEFWTRYVLGTERPPVDTSASTREALRQAEPPEPGTGVELTSDLVAALAQYQRAKAEAKAAEDRAEATAAIVQDHLLAAAADHGTYHNDVLVTWKSYEHRGIDTKALAAEHPELAERFTTTDVRRRFTVRATRENGNGC